MTPSHLINSVAETTAHRDRDDLDRAIVRLLQQFLEAQRVSLLRLVDDGEVRRVARRVEVSRHRSELGPVSMEDPDALPALADVPAWQRCVGGNQLVQEASRDGTILSLFPVHVEPDVVGILVIESGGALLLRDVDMVCGILRIIENHFALLDYGERDTLTGLLNRKTFEAQFDKLRQRLCNPRDGTLAEEPSWLALMDIDRFKSINDSYGHLFGDEVLLLISQLMERNIRGTDPLFRFGGEEFLIVLDHASESGAQIALERLRIAVETHVFPQVGSVTVSVGYTKIDPRDVPTTCVARADAALYYAKNHGRNNVRNYETLVATRELVVQESSADIEMF